jgi:hypothetical protein
MRSVLLVRYSTVYWYTARPASGRSITPTVSGLCWIFTKDFVDTMGKLLPWRGRLVGCCYEKWQSQSL